MGEPRVVRLELLACQVVLVPLGHGAMELAGWVVVSNSYTASRVSSWRNRYPSVASSAR